MVELNWQNFIEEVRQRLLNHCLKKLISWYMENTFQFLFTSSINSIWFSIYCRNLSCFVDYQSRFLVARNNIGKDFIPLQLLWIVITSETKWAEILTTILFFWLVGDHDWDKFTNFSASVVSFKQRQRIECQQCHKYKDVQVGATY